MHNSNFWWFTKCLRDLIYTAIRQNDHRVHWKDAIEKPTVKRIKKKKSHKNNCTCKGVNLGCVCVYVFKYIISQFSFCYFASAPNRSKRKSKHSDCNASWSVILHNTAVQWIVRRTAAALSKAVVDQPGAFLSETISPDTWAPKPFNLVSETRWCGLRTSQNVHGTIWTDTISVVTQTKYILPDTGIF